MAHDPTYTNFHVARGSAEDENVYSNFCNHPRGSAALRGKQGWRREVTCGGWTILCGRACIIYSTVTIIFFITLFLLISCLANVKDLNEKMDKKEVVFYKRVHLQSTQDEQTHLNNTVSQLKVLRQTIEKDVTDLNDTVSQLKVLRQTIEKDVTDLNDTVSQLKVLRQTIEKDVTDLNNTVSQLKVLRQTIEKDVTDLNDTVLQLRELPQTIQEEMKLLNICGWNDLYQNMSIFSGNCFSSDKSGCCDVGKQCTLIELQIAVDNKGRAKVCSKTNDSNSDSTGTQHETTSVSSITATSLNQGISKPQGD